jgi:hypothetical protein
MDIDFRDFEMELSGKSGGPGATGTGFGDKSAQENLQKMVARFGEFLSEDAAAEASDGRDEMDSDDDEDATVSSEGEDKDGGFDENEFTEMMREMMGMSPETMRELMCDTARPKSATTPPTSRPSAASAQSDSDDDAEIRRLSKAMESELKMAGALRLGSTTKVKGKQKLIGNGRVLDDGDDAAEDSDDDEILDPGFNLVQNMLESVKSQAGMAGPGGNLMGMMGIQLPRDEGESRPLSSAVGSRRS